MKISQALYDELVAHAREEAPNECCGFVGSKDGTAVAVHRVENEFHSPLRYQMDSRAQVRAYLAIEDAGLEVGAIYHSHTRSEPYPSQTDVNRSVDPKTRFELWPGALYIIVGLDSGPEAKVRAYTIREGQVAEAVLTVI
jgi:[CysO sulfur-carrier protein]-S-L-cysteine hydrolase